MKLEIWDPKTGEKTTVKYFKYVWQKGEWYTEFGLDLKAVNSVFLVGY
nr:hypothetical protein [Mucilaginibacter sp. L294]